MYNILSSIFRKILNKITIAIVFITGLIKEKNTLTSLNCWLISSLFILSLFFSSMQMAQKRSPHTNKRKLENILYLVILHLSKHVAPKRRQTWGLLYYNNIRKLDLAIRHIRWRKCIFTGSELLSTDKLKIPISCMLETVG